MLLALGGVLKICDFGLARRPGPNLTPGSATLWYRAPELLLADPACGAPIDVWATGCVCAELVTRKPFVPGQGELDQIALIGKLQR